MYNLQYIVFKHTENYDGDKDNDGFLKSRDPGAFLYNYIVYDFF